MGETVRHIAASALRILPTELKVAAATSSQRNFVRSYADGMFLLVQIGDAHPELMGSLVALDRSPRREGQLMTWRTRRLQKDDVRALETALRHDDDPLERRIEHVKQRLLRHDYFAVLLEKRSAGELFGQRVVVGRARNSDVVLRDASVSKLQAWFERDESGQLLLTDAGATNATRINAHELHTREPVEVATGDVITFGTVVTMLASADALWHVLHA